MSEEIELPNLICCSKHGQCFVGPKQCEFCHEYVSADRVRELVELLKDATWEPRKRLPAVVDKFEELLKTEKE